MQTTILKKFVSALGKLSGERHDPAVLPLEYQPPLPIDQHFCESSYISDAVKKGVISACAGSQAPGHPA